MNPSFSTETYTPDRLHAGDFPIVTAAGTILSGNNLTRGTVLGKITASGKLIAVDSAAADGSQTPYAILAQDTDASGADTTAPLYLSGEFNEGELTFGGADTADTHRAALRDLGIHLKAAIGA